MGGLIIRFRGSKLLLACIFSSLPTIAAPQDGDTTRYEVELIAFRHLDRSGSTTETRTPRQSMLPETAAGSMVNDDPAAMPQRAGVPDSQRVDPLSASQLQLTGIYQRLRQLDAYGPILHTGWTQPARSTKEAVPNRIGRSGGQSQLAGSVTLYKQRYLHLNLDLTVGARDASPEPQARIFGDVPSETVPTDLALRLQESRRIRLEDVNYFDHPELGVIVSVRKMADETEEAPDGGD